MDPASRRDKPSWAILASSGTVEPGLLTETGIDPLSTVSTNLSLFLVPSICHFMFHVRASRPRQLGTRRHEQLCCGLWAYCGRVGPSHAPRSHTRKYGYYSLQLSEGQDSLVRHLGPRAGELSPHINMHGPCLSAVSCTSSSHPDDYRTLLSRLGGAAIAAAILSPAPVLQQVIITSSDKTKEKTTWPLGIILSSPS